MMIGRRWTAWVVVCSYYYYYGGGQCNTMFIPIYLSLLRGWTTRLLKMGDREAEREQEREREREREYHVCLSVVLSPLSLSLSSLSFSFFLSFFGQSILALNVTRKSPPGDS
jgi:hypothetical protein